MLKPINEGTISLRCVYLTPDPLSCPLLVLNKGGVPSQPHILLQICLCPAFLTNFHLAEGFWGEEQPHGPLYGLNLSTGPVAGFVISEAPPPQQLSQVLFSVCTQVSIMPSACATSSSALPLDWSTAPERTMSPQKVSVAPFSHPVFWESYYFVAAILLPGSHINS